MDRLVRAFALACFTLALPMGGAATAAKPQALEPGRYKLEGPEVAIYNLAGELRAVEGSGNSVVVEITTGGRDAGRLTVEEGTEKGIPVLRVVYPETRIVYPGGYGPPGGVDSYIGFDHRRYHVTGKGPGLEAHADLRVLIPRGKRVHLNLAVGRGFINDVEGEISFKGASSTVEAGGVSGALALEVGSGDILVSRCSAQLAADTGSGTITISELDGNLSADAGSGDIHLKRVGAEKISLDAGSGSITGSDIKAAVMSVDCGSGEIDLDGTTVGRMAMDAGSGSVHLRMTQSIDDLAIDAGSGSVKLEAPRDLSARFTIECPRRHLHIDFPTEIERGDDDVTVGTIGSGRGRIRIEAGSGSVALVRM